MAEPLKVGTLAVHAGEHAPASGAVTTPIVRSSTFHFPDSAAVDAFNAGTSALYEYSRLGNPTVHAAEEKLATLEGAEAALLTASGMAAISTTLLATLSAGDEVLCQSAVYGGAFRFLRDTAPRFGIHARFVEAGALVAAIEDARPGTKAVYFETPVNPTLRLVDLSAVAKAAKARGLVSIVDSTFGTPVLQRPLAHGVDLVVHSVTKYLNGHTDAILGAVLGSAKQVQPVRSLARQLGPTVDAGVAFELLRGLKTLPLRVRRQSETALAVALALRAHPAVAAAHYPALPDHPDHALYERQMHGGAGGVVTFTLKGGEAAARRAFDGLRLVARAASLGGVESVCSLPVITSHVGFSAAELSSAGIDRGMMRFSLGLEDAEDLVADLRQAFDRAL